MHAGRVAEALALVRQMIEQEPARRDEITLFGLSLCETQPDVAFAVIDLAADAAVAAEDWASAAAGLQELVTRVPMYLPALMRLVEVCVDGGLEATMFSAQAQLADAYIEAGAADEARYVAEDLVAREPWDRANIERFRMALTMLGELEPDALIAERLSGESPFTSTDVSILAANGADILPLDQDDEPDESQWKVDNHNFEFSSSSFDNPESTPEGDGGSDDDEVEVDLSVALDDLRSADSTFVPPPSDAADAQEIPDAPAMPEGLEGVLGQLRDEATRSADLATAEEEYSRGVGLHAIGQVDDSIPLLASASRAPQLRFATASLLGRIYRQQGETARAVEWLEQAAQAPPTCAEDGHLLLYDLAEMLESSGEYTRALAICMELQADAGDYRDIRERVSRLTTMQMRG